MARNRRRAAERKGRRRPEDANGAPKDRLHREEQPGSLDHASGEVDEVEARIVAGAGGEPSALDDDELLEDEEAFEEEEEAFDEEVQEEEVEEDRGRRRQAPAPAVDAPAAGRGGPRFLNFLRASWAELKRVQWPDRRQVAQATAVVLGFVVVAGAFLGIVDVITQELVDLII